jgi:hypothetical protein
MQARPSFDQPGKTEAKRQKKFLAFLRNCPGGQDDKRQAKAPWQNAGLS